MKYDEIVRWLFQQIPNYQSQGEKAYKPGLENISKLLEELDNPQHQFKSVHIAGTNGKGSVSHILAAAFQSHQYKTGLFTSPHIKDFRERIKINGAWIDKEFVVNFLTRHQNVIEQLRPSFFEITTAMAFSAFAGQNCDIAIIETGLGGRLDSTNVLTPEMAIITNIGIDHVGFLGDTLEAIAKEKAGIIKPDTPVVIGDLLPELTAVFEEIADEKNSELILSSQLTRKRYETDLLGEFQQRNIHTAHTALKELSESWNLNEQTTLNAFKRIATITQFHGRLEKVGENPLVLFDAAHNEAGIQNLIAEVSKFSFNTLRVIYGASNDKNWKSVIKKFPVEGIYYFSEFESARSVKKEEFYEEAEHYNLVFNVFENPKTAFERCKQDADKEDLILVCGSFYLMEKII